MRGEKGKRTLGVESGNLPLSGAGLEHVGVNDLTRLHRDLIGDNNANIESHIPTISTLHLE